MVDGLMIGQIVYLAICYTLVFAGYYAATSFLTILYPDFAFVSFAIFYGVYAVSSLCSPFVVSKLNLRLCIAVSAFTFLIFVGAVSSKVVVFMLIGSGITGAFNATIWLSQALWMLDYPTENRSSMIGLFFGIFSVNIVIGGLLALIVLLTGLSVQMMLWIVLGVVGIGVIMSIFIPPFSCYELVHNRSNSQNKEANFVKSIKDVFVIVTEKRGYLLIPLFIIQAIDLNVSFQTVTRLLIINAHGDQSMNVYNAAVYLSYGASAIIFALLFGKIYSRFGWKYVLVPYLVLNVVCIVGITLLAILSSNGPLGLWILIGFIKGAVDYALNILINVSISNTYQDRADLMFGFYRFIYPLAYVVVSIMIGYVWYPWILLINGVFALLTSYCFWIFNRSDDLETQFDKSSVVISSLV